MRILTPRYRSMGRFGTWMILLLVCTGTRILAGAELNPVFVTWLAAQSQIRTWSADFVQTRALKALAQPLTAAGHLWFAAPNQFRWELGVPAQTVAVRAGSELLILYPRLKRVERFPMAEAQSGPWRDALALLETGFPRSQSELEVQYAIVSQTARGQRFEVDLEPKSNSARRMIPRIKIEFGTQDLSLLATQLQFADGSTMRNEFTHPVLNGAVDSSLFQPAIPDDYKVVEPLKK